MDGRFSRKAPQKLNKATPGSRLVSAKATKAAQFVLRSNT